MTHSGTVPAIAAARARRAVEAMFRFRAWRSSLPVPALVLAGATSILVFAYSRYRRDRGALEAEAATPAERSRGRWFNILSARVLPAAMFVIGLHFIPLARLFCNPAHYVTGAALIALAIAYPLFAPAGPQDTVGCFVTGILLWASTVWTVTARRVRSPNADTGQE